MFPWKVHQRSGNWQLSHAIRKHKRSQTPLEADIEASPIKKKDVVLNRNCAHFLDYRSTPFAENPLLLLWSLATGFYHRMLDSYRISLRSFCYHATYTGMSPLFALLMTIIVSIMPWMCFIETQFLFKIQIRFNNLDSKNPGVKHILQWLCSVGQIQS